MIRTVVAVVLVLGGVLGLAAVHGEGHFNVPYEYALRIMGYLIVGLLIGQGFMLGTLVEIRDALKQDHGRKQLSQSDTAHTTPASF